VSEWKKREQKEKEWNDAVPDEEGEERPETDEQVYRDGSVKHECWGNEN